MKKILISLFSIFSLIIINSKIESNIFEQTKPSKVIKFEGAYEGVTSESFDENSGIIENFDYSEIKFFVEQPKELDKIEFDRPLITDSIFIAQEKLKNIRAITSEIIVENNISIIDELIDIAPKEDFSIGTFSSVIKLTIDNQILNEELIDKVDDVFQESERINEIYISEPIVIDSSEMTSAFPIINVTSMINSGLFTGRNVNVGIAESGGVPNVPKYPDDYSGRNILIKSGDSGSSDHADHVTMIAVGNNGIARGSNILSSYGSPYNNNHMSWFLENNTNIVNTSYGDKTISTGGTYTSVAKEMDEIIKNSFITVVGSAGNNDSTYNSSNVTSPKTAYNYITVGASQGSSPSNSTIRTSSCYGEQLGYGASKPNLVAPGTIVTNSYEGDSKSGTSFAAPQVTGCIALLMEEFPYLIGYPELITSIVTSSASPMSSIYNVSNGDNHYDLSGLHNQIGSGLLNYEKMREAAETCLDIFVPSNSSPEEVVDYIEFDANANQRIRASLAWLANGTDTNNFTNYDLYLHKKNGSTYKLMKYIDGTTNNVEFLDFDVQLSGTYRLSVKQNETNVTGDYLGLSYVLIDDSIGGSTSGGKYGHVYEYTSISDTKHRAICLAENCGEIIEENHTFRITGIGTPSICIYCGKTSGGGIPGIFPLNNNNNNKEYVTENGSFKLFNGVTYLVEQDIEAYLNGSLIFIPVNSSKI